MSALAGRHQLGSEAGNDAVQHDREQGGRVAPITLIALPYIALVALVTAGLATAIALTIAWSVVVFASFRCFAHPSVSLLPYLAFVFIVPPVAISTGAVDYNLGFGAEITGPGYWLPLMLAASGFYAGLRWGAKRSWSAAPERTTRGYLSMISETQASMMRDAGRALLAVMIIYRLAFLQEFGAFSFSVFGDREVTDRTVIEAAIAICSPSAILLVTIGNVALTRDRRAMGRTDVVLAVSFVAISLLIGTRAELVPFFLVPIVMVDRFVRRIHVLKVGAVVIVMFLTFSAVAEARQGRDAALFVDAPVVQVLTDPIKSPALILADGISAADEDDELAFGRTYLHSIPYLLPAPVSNQLFGPVDGSGARVLRDSLGYRGDSGIGYSFPLEWYVNFGLVGMVGGGLLFGFALGKMYAAFVAARSFAGLVLWPVVVARLAIATRSDFLASVNGMLYTVGLCFLINLVAYSNRRLRQSPDRRAVLGAPVPHVPATRTWR